MSGVEVVAVVAGVAAIVSGFADGFVLFRRWKARSASWRLRSARTQTERELQSSGPDVRRVYDHHFARLGQRFAVGHGMYPSALFLMAT